MMKPRVIANPPMGIYNNPQTHIGHAFFLVLLDTIARHKSKQEETKVIFPGRSYNLYGKRAETLFNSQKEEGFKDLGERHRDTIQKDVSREKLNLSSLELLTDDEPQIVLGVQKDFQELYQKGYSLRVGSTFFLDCSAIARKRNITSMLDGIRFYPDRTRIEIQRLLRENTKQPLAITRDTKYAITNPLGGDNIGPLFALASLWDYKYPEHDITMAASDSVVAKYVFLRLLIKAALNEGPGMDEVIVWPRVVPEGGVEAWDINELVKDQYHGDMLRCAILSTYSKREQRVEMKKDRLKGARNFVYMLANLRRPLHGPFFLETEVIKPYIYKLNNLDFSSLLSDAENRVREISIDINLKRRSNNWSEFVRKELASEYCSIVNALEPILPATTALINRDMAHD